MITMSGASSLVSRMAVLPSADDVDSLLLEQVLETCPEEVVIVDDQDTELVELLVGARFIRNGPSAHARISPAEKEVTV
jgi:hypothetical protein